MKSLPLRRLPQLAAAISAFLAMEAVHGVSFTFTATLVDLDDSAGLLPGSFTLGATATGSAWYDPSKGGLDGNGNPNLGSYTFHGSNADGFQMNLVVGGDTLASIPSVSSPFNQINVNAFAGALEYYSGNFTLNGGTFSGAATGQEFRLNFGDTSLTTLTSDALPTLTPTADLFPNWSQVWVSAWNDTDYSTARFDITSLTPVPEPGEWAAIAGGGLAAFAAIRRRRHGRVRGGGR